ncbi:MAG TPA: permease prefix domain 2-containing transporter [Terracidiphilus sp.]|nr:permease prefix domain 2-containing transporter [Terracidiphilus sp.]
MKESAKTPPHWMESLLERLLPAQTREEIVGDLREEYIESVLPQRGRLRANLWYARNALSFVPKVLRESKTMATLLVGCSVLTAICMGWLASMEMVLRHAGFGTRMALDVCFALLCLVTAYFRMRSSPRTRSEMCLRGGGLLTILFGAQAFVHNARAAHFEGFVFVISLLLMAQGMLMQLTLGRIGENHSRLQAK